MLEMLKESLDPLFRMLNGLSVSPSMSVRELPSFRKAINTYDSRTTSSDAGSHTVSGENRVAPLPPSPSHGASTSPPTSGNTSNNGGSALLGGIAGGTSPDIIGSSFQDRRMVFAAGGTLPSERKFSQSNTTDPKPVRISGTNQVPIANVGPKQVRVSGSDNVNNVPSLNGAKSRSLSGDHISTVKQVRVSGASDTSVTPNLTPRSLAAKTKTMFVQPHCPGKQIMVRPNPNLTDKPVGSIKSDQRIEVFSDLVSGYFKLSDGSVSSDVYHSLVVYMDGLLNTYCGVLYVKLYMELKHMLIAIYFNLGIYI
jgi:hypothetical protein